ncbi:WYL domain-containing protein [Paenibacillus hexagrammi]|uniref:WYL domain-containing protein n=1 Tax=Paenibacillus hexagrammi TaxID=2908839 RepID=A0ABY3SFT7_9BACL|nr:WYL domain-containing protein [Paenibacillus sp. YPD9-1]UJF32629.1 WYL domain-containing protein [Paenibacillus sp. YPD9-1]
MNLFEKIFNYQILSRLEDSGTFVVTSQERAWLRLMLQHPAAAEAFAPDTLQKLAAMLDGDSQLDVSGHLVEKANVSEQPVYHPLLRPLRRLIMNRSGMRISYRLKNGTICSEVSGLPYHLEYSMVKREWYLLWYHLRHRAFMSTRLNKIDSVSYESIDPATASDLFAWIKQTLEARKTEVTVEVDREYNRELSRILYAFSCFDKAVDYEEKTDTYRIRIRLMGDEMEYLLSKIRFLGKRVRVIEGWYLRKRMLEASMKALARYGELAE